MPNIQKQFRKMGKALRRFFQRVGQGSPLDIAILATAMILAAALAVILVFTLTADNSSSALGAGQSSVLTPGLSDAADDDYDHSAAAIDETQYDGTILPAGEDAGESYISSTLFIGDSNTERMVMYGATTLQNNLGVVGMGIQNVTGTPCIYFQGYSSPVYVAKAVELLQPQRIIITFGTNNTSWDAATFKEQYRKALKAIHEAYPAADILINAVPPVAQQRSYPNISMTTIDSFNLALVALAQEEGYYFINSSEALKDAATGYAKEGYMVSDGIHLSEAGMDALMQYIRTHAYDAQNKQAVAAAPVHLATPESMFGTSSSSQSSSSSSSSSSAKVTVKFSIKGDQDGGTLTGTLTQTVAPGDTCSKVSLTLNPGYKAVWGCTEGRIEDNTSITALSFVVPAYTKLETIDVWVTLTKTECTQHTYTETVTQQATCGVAGVKTFTCSVCKHTYAETIAPTGQHTYEVVHVVEATCQPGEKELRCTVCGLTMKEVLPATAAHSNQVTAETPAQPGVDGVRTYTCTVCGAVTTTVIPALPVSSAPEESEPSVG